MNKVYFASTKLNYNSLDFSIFIKRKMITTEVLYRHYRKNVNIYKQIMGTIRRLICYKHNIINTGNICIFTCIKKINNTNYPFKNSTDHEYFSGLENNPLDNETSSNGLQTFQMQGQITTSVYNHFVVILQPWQHQVSFNYVATPYFKQYNLEIITSVCCSYFN